MFPANIELKLDNKAIQQHIEKKLDETILTQLWLVDVERLVQLTSMSRRWLEDEILCDPRMRLIERRKNRKRWWPAELALQVITEITNEW